MQAYREGDKFAYPMKIYLVQAKKSAKRLRPNFC